MLQIAIVGLGWAGSRHVEAASASFEPSRAAQNQLEGVNFCRKVISAWVGQYCLLGLFGNSGPQKRFRNG